MQSKLSIPCKDLKGSLILCENLKDSSFCELFISSVRDQISVYEPDTCLVLSVCEYFNRPNREEIESGFKAGKYSRHSA